MKIGADPELFLVKNGEFYSAHGIIPGTKAEPYKVNAGAVQVDGMALEFNIDPVENCDDWINNITLVMDTMREMVPNNMHMAIEACAHFTDEHMNTQPWEARQLGCDPDFNAYTGRENLAPDAISNMRTAAGHVHVGFVEGDPIEDIHSNIHMQECIQVVKQLDYFLALPAMLFEDNERRQMYGKAGSFRPKPYGVEYRVLSNFWLLSNDLAAKVFNNTKAAVDNMKRGNVLTNISTSPEKIINEGNVQAAVDLMLGFNNPLIQLWNGFREAGPQEDVPIPPQRQPGGGDAMQIQREVIDNALLQVREIQYANIPVLMPEPERDN